MTASSGYSGKPLARKLGLVPGCRLRAMDAPGHYEALLGAEGDSVAVERVTRAEQAAAPAEIVHLFVADRAGLAAAAPAALAGVAAGGMLWVSWPKKSSTLFRDLTEDGVREVLLPTGWVDVKVAAVDEDWSALKFLRRRPR